MGGELEHLTEKVAAFIGTSATGGPSSEEFDQLAIEVFDFQYRYIPAYGNLCRRRGVTPGALWRLEDVPAVPADAFKYFDLFAAPKEHVVKTFHSSGTTSGSQSSRALFSRSGLDLMDLAIERNAARSLRLKPRAARILGLAPRPETAPTTVMVYGINRMIECLGAPGSHFLLESPCLDGAKVVSELQRCETEGAPVILIGASFAFVQLFTYQDECDVSLQLPPGSILAHTGGYKGRSREVERGAFLSMAERFLGMPSERVINLLGMTELASQIYDVLPCCAKQAGTLQGKTPPHWMRTMLVDPAGVERAGCRQITASNRIGILRHLDLGNVERPMVVQSEDLGIWCPSQEQGAGAVPARRFEILGRVAGAECRGCSLTHEDLQQDFLRSREDAAARGGQRG
jgi:hypothetical protein